MLILGLETSCDDTAAAVLQGRNSLLSNVINDQTNIHSKFGGIVPELAGRSHIDQVHRVINQSLQSAHVKLKDIDLRIAINQEYVKDDRELKDGDEVVLIPPVQGG